jgi:phage antirepressor YoqD-like protein
MVEESKDKQQDYMFVARHEAMVAKEKNVWLVDSGSTSHMVKDKELFVTLDEQERTSVVVGNKAVIQSKGKGTVRINTKKGARYIQDVLLVPELENNLLSVGQIVDNDYSILLKKWLL